MNAPAITSMAPGVPGPSWGGASHAGSRCGQPTLNNDRWQATAGLFAVADGAGPEVGAGRAAEIAIETVSRMWAHMAHSALALRSAVETASALIGAAGLGESRSSRYTTYTALFVADSREDPYLIAHVGDSAVVRVRDGMAERITADHGLGDPLAPGLVTRLVGQSDPLTLDIVEAERRNGDRFVIATDGVTKWLSLDAIARIVIPVQDPQTAAEALNRAARSMGSNDDRTSLVIQQDRIAPAQPDAPSTAALVGHPVAPHGTLRQRSSVLRHTALHLQQRAVEADMRDHSTHRFREERHD